MLMVGGLVHGCKIAGPIAPWDTSRYVFNFTESAVCVTQEMSAVCPGGEFGRTGAVCVPIEPLGLDFTVAKGASWPDDPFVVYKTEALSCRQKFPRFVYLDLGAEHYPSSVGGWFQKRYPNHYAFRIIALEGDPYKNGLRAGRSWRAHPEVEMLQFAAWTSNTTVEFLSEGFGAHMTSGQNLTGALKNGQNVNLNVYGDRKQTKHLVHVKTLDIADFLQRNFAKEDYVVVKMDIEGGEFALVPHLIAAGVAPLIDEMFLEVHWQKRNSTVWNKKPLAAGQSRASAIDLVAKLRDANVYAHEWR